MSLYHKQVFWPKGVLSKFEGKTWNLKFGTHAKNSCYTDRYGFIIPPMTITFHENDAFEMEVNNGIVVKVVIRQPYTGKTHNNIQLDVIFVIIPPEIGNIAFVKTLWFNVSTDKHYTLDKTKYSTV